MKMDFIIKSETLERYTGAEAHVVIPNGVTIIGHSAFHGCTSLTSVTIPDSVTEIKEYAFSGCTGLTSVTIPDSVTEIGYDAFENCTSLTSITIPGSVITFWSNAFRNTAYWNNDANWENGVLYIGHHLINAKSNLAGAYSIKPGTRTIGSEAFQDCKSLTSITIPDSVTVIDFAAFKNCTSLISITIPDSVTKIENYAFKNCTSLTSVTIPDSVTKIDLAAFENCTSLTTVIIPDSVMEIGGYAFKSCTSLTSVTIPGSVTVIDFAAFEDCTSLTSITIPDSVTKIGNAAFKNCTSLTSVTIPDSVTKIGNAAFKNCTSLTSVTIPDSVITFRSDAFRNTAYWNNDANWENGVLYIGHHLINAKSNLSEAYSIKPDTRIIGGGAFQDCKSLTSITIPDSVTEIEEDAFYGCTGLTSVTIPDSVTKIDSAAFKNCVSLTSVTIPDSVTEIGGAAFADCTSLTSITIPDSVMEIGGYAFKNCTSMTLVTIPGSVTVIGSGAFEDCTSLTAVCSEGSHAHKYYIEHRLNFIFDYQYEAFHGVLPPGLSKLASPFPVDEKVPFVFISYSHKDRSSVFEILKPLYEAGWRIWYDEGLTIGDRYDETIEAHVKSCSAFLLFITEHTSESIYIQENEIPWAVRYGKPIIRCILGQSGDHEITKGNVLATVAPSGVEAALEHVDGLARGEERAAYGISVLFNPADREMASDGFAYCVYSAQSIAAAKAVMLEAKNSGCKLYDAVESGEDAERLSGCSSLLVFMDRAFLSDTHLTTMLGEAFLSGRDIAVCQIGEIDASDLPKALTGLYELQWLNYVHGNTIDLNTKLARHLQKRGCRNAAVLPGFDYERTDKGIVITRYNGMNPEPVIKCGYSAIPVVKIANSAFANRIHLKQITIPANVTEIEEDAFYGCTGLTSITIPDSVTEIGNFAFSGCTGLTSITIPDSVTEIGNFAFYGCTGLTSITIPDSVTEIGNFAFFGCTGLTSITVPDSVTEIGSRAFENCVSLTSITIPDSITKIRRVAFGNCTSLTSVTIPDSATEIEDDAFSGCTNLTIRGSEGSYAERYAKKNHIPFVSY